MNSTNMFSVSLLYTGGLLLALNSCGTNRATAPGDPVNADAGGVDSARPVDAAAPLLPGVSQSSQSSSTLTSSGMPTSMPTSVPTLSDGVMTAAPSEALSVTPSVTAASTGPGEGPVPGISLPGQTNCEGSFSTSTSTFTYYDVVCDADTVWANCTLEPTEINCVCGNRSTSQLRFYTLPLGTDLETASRASVPLCNAPSGLSAVDVECEETQPTSDTECSVRKTCTSVWDLGDGIEAFEETTQYPVYCTALGPTASECTCSNPFQMMTVHGVGTEQACAAAAPVCDSEVPLDEDISCSGFELSLYPGNCNATRRCGYRADLDQAGDVFALTSAFLRPISCSEDGAGSSQCYCFEGEMNPFLQGSVLADADTACLVANDVCYSESPLQENGAMECTSLSAAEVDGACSGSATCAQEFSNGTGAMQLGADMYAGCLPAANGAWSCTCSSAFAETLPQAITAASAVDACVQALDSCVPRGHLEIQDNHEVAVVFSASPGTSDAGTSDPTP